MQEVEKCRLYFLELSGKIDINSDHNFAIGGCQKVTCVSQTPGRGGGGDRQRAGLNPPCRLYISYNNRQTCYPTEVSSPCFRMKNKSMK
jgi:hypothetical protein